MGYCRRRRHYLVSTTRRILVGGMPCRLTSTGARSVVSSSNMPNILVNMKPLIRLVRSAGARRFSTYPRHLCRKHPERAEICLTGQSQNPASTKARLNRPTAITASANPARWSISSLSPVRRTPEFPCTRRTNCNDGHVLRKCSKIALVAVSSPAYLSMKSKCPLLAWSEPGSTTVISDDARSNRVNRSRSRRPVARNAGCFLLSRVLRLGSYGL